MQSIENITLENWPVSNERDESTNPVLHFAIKQEGMDLAFQLEQLFHDNRISFHYFESFDQLTTICHRHLIDAIFLAGRSDFMAEVQMVQTIKANVLLSIIPVLLVNPNADISTVVAAYQNGVEEFIYGQPLPKLVQVRIDQAIKRSRRDLAVNPSTSLPGPSTIEKEINRQLTAKERFAVCYADLDNFKAYNDYYGYFFGDKIIRMTGRILRDVVFDLCPEGFIGHIAGDDFICVIPADLVNPVCGWIIKCFDSFIQFRYEPADIERGFIETSNRRGQMEQYPILSISIAVIINDNGEFKHVGELSRMLADLKKATKALDGSNFLVERRKKY